MLKKAALAFYSLLLIGAGIAFADTARSSPMTPEQIRNQSLYNLCARRGAGLPVNFAPNLGPLMVDTNGFARLRCQRGTYIAEWVQYQ
jgi:hypothetical protein